MYERFYQLRERPFALSPDPDYLYPSRVHKEALGYLRYGIEGHAGFVVITGEIGSGKTTLLQTLLRGLDQQTTVARLMNTMLGPEELIESILLDFGIETTGRKPVMLKQLADFLVSERTAGRLVLLVIDEAQNLSLPALEEVRMLSNLETEKSKLIQIVLVGQPDLRAKLAQPGLEQLRQRVTVSYHLNPLDADETEAYINHRLRRAAAGPAIEFPREVTDLVHARSQGIPRIVIVICDAMLLFGYGAEQHTIDRGLADEALSELEATGVLPSAASLQAAISTPPAQLTEPRAIDRPELAPRTVNREPASDAVARVARDAAREAAILAREAQLARREEELAEQRRVLAEQARLLRETRAEAARTAESRASGAAWPPVAYPRPPQPSAPRAFTPSSDAPRQGLWHRVRRALAGAPAPALDERS
jgi:putative secretion ATPase (PEP-CTERM system associated)